LDRSADVIITLPVTTSTLPSNVKLLSTEPLGAVPSKVIIPLLVVPLNNNNPDVPAVPLLPDEPEVPLLPLLPAVDELPDVPLLPLVPDVPLLPLLPAVDELPLVPAVDELPDVPLLPDEPLLPLLPDEPDVPFAAVFLPTCPVVVLNTKTSLEVSVGTFDKCNAPVEPVTHNLKLPAPSDKKILQFWVSLFKAPYEPITTLQFAVVIYLPAPHPIPVFLLPQILQSESIPIAVLLTPLQLSRNALVPIPIFSIPDVLRCNATLPIAILQLPPDVFCHNAHAPMEILYNPLVFLHNASNPIATLLVPTLISHAIALYPIAIFSVP
jgi:hypothetical protein